jgi:hypothetical protein
MSAPCSRCDCADFKGESGAEYCLACWHPRGAHHLLVCPECGATIEPVRIPLEAASVGEGWLAGPAGPEVHVQQQALWESGTSLESLVPGADEETPVTPIPAIDDSAPGEREPDSEESPQESAEGEREEPGVGATEAEPPARRPALFRRRRRHARP